MAVKRTPAAPAPPAALAARLIELPPLSVRADLAPSSINQDDRTVELIFTTAAPVERYDYETGKRYLEVLSMDPEHVRIDRLNQGGPLLDSHSTWSVSDILGAVVPGSVVIAKSGARAMVKFSKRAEVEPIWQDVRDGIVRSVSVGYRIYKYEEQEATGNKLPVRVATDWEPYEISMVPVPADFGAHARGAKPADTNQCQLEVMKESTMKARTAAPGAAGDEGNRSESIDATPGAASAQAAAATAAAAAAGEGGGGGDEPASERDLATQAERERTLGIRQACSSGRMSRAFEDQLIASGKPLVDCQRDVFVEMQRRVDPSGAPSPAAGQGGRREVMVGDEAHVHVRAGIEGAILHRVAGDIRKPDGTMAFPLTEVARPYRAMSMLRVAEVMLNAMGIRTTDMSKMELAGVALGLVQRGGMHTSSDFPLLLADVARKTLRAAYAEAPQTFTTFSRRVTLPDFKMSNRMQLGDAPALLEVKEHGEFKRGTIAEGREQFQLKTYGRVFAITRQALVNDETDAFSRVPTAFGRSARNLESDLVYAQITSNPVMGDGVTLFHATHGNLAAAGAVISDVTLGEARRAMRVQKGLDGVTPLNINPEYLATPAALETTAAKQLAVIIPGTAGAVNPFAGLLKPLVEPRLDVASAIAWYVIAGAGADVIEYGYLEGEEGPMVESRVGFDVDGLEIKCREDFGAKVIDWRGIYKNPGA